MSVQHTTAMVVLVLMASVPAHAQTCALTKKYGDLGTLFDKLGNGPTDYCATDACQSALAQNITKEYKKEYKFEMSDKSYPTSLMTCMCDSTIQQNAFITKGGLVNVGGEAAGMKDFCANPTCKDDVLNAEVANHGAIAFLICLGKQDCNIPQIKEEITECVCDANAQGYHYYWGRDVANDGTAGTFCGIPSCSSMSNLVAPHIDLMGCGTFPLWSLGPIVGGIITIVVLCCCLARQKKLQQQRAHAANTMPKATATMPQATATAVPMPTATAVPIAAGGNGLSEC